MQLALLSDPSSANGIKAIQQILAAQKKGFCKIGYIASEPEPDRDYFRQTQALYHKLGAQLDDFLELEAGFDEKVFVELLSCDVIHLAGGDTFRFLNGLTQRGCLPRLREYASQGGGVIGVSAGAMIMTPSIESAMLCGDRNDVGLKSLFSLSLTEFHFMPHLPSGFNTPVDFITALRKKGTKFDDRSFERLYLCQDNAALTLIDGDINELGAPLLWTRCVA